MDTILQSQVFFFISSIGFIILWVLLAILLLYLISSVRALYKIIKKIEMSINNLGDVTKDLLEELKGNAIFKFIFGNKRKSRKD